MAPLLMHGVLGVSAPSFVSLRARTNSNNGLKVPCYYGVSAACAGRCVDVRLERSDAISFRRAILSQPQHLRLSIGCDKSTLRRFESRERVSVRVRASIPDEELKRRHEIREKTEQTVKAASQEVAEYLRHGLTRGGAG